MNHLLVDLGINTVVHSTWVKFTTIKDANVYLNVQLARIFVRDMFNDF